MRMQEITLAGACLLCAGCASTHVATTYTNDALTERLPTKILVAADVPTAAARHEMERQLADDLSKAGVQAVPYTSLETSGETPSESDVQTAARSQGFDGVLSSRLVGTSPHYTYMPGYYGMYGWGYGGYWGPIPAAQIETDLFRIGPDQPQLIWSGATSTLSSGASGTTMDRRDIDHYSKVVTNRLRRDVSG